MDFSTFKEGQLRCVKTLDAPVAVSAGAGSGKTFTLTQRIAWALLPGSGADGAPFLEGIDQVLAITFTDKAAGEIKSRVKATLAAEGMAAQALKVDDAWISTIHGMCSRILRMHATELGIDPAFRCSMRRRPPTCSTPRWKKCLRGKTNSGRRAVSMRCFGIPRALAWRLRPNVH